MRNRPTDKDCKWDEITLVLSVELTNVMEEYIESTGALADPATRASITDAEIVSQATATMYARLIDDEANACAIAWLQTIAKENVTTIWDNLDD